MAVPRIRAAAAATVATAAATAAVLVAACGAGENSDAVPFTPVMAGADTLRSAGSAAAAFHDVPGLTLLRETVIDGAVEDLVSVGWIAIADDGSVAVSQSQDGRVRFFSAEGTDLGAVGARGQGPGEFELMNGAGWVGDTLWIHDGRQSRISLFGPDRTFIRTVPTPNLLAGATVGSSSVSALALLADGRILGRTADLHEEGTTSYVVLGADAARWEIMGEMAHVPSVSTAFRFSTTGMSGSLAVPYAMRRRDAIAPIGNRVAYLTAAVDGEAAGTFEVMVFTTGGDTVYQRGYPFDAVPIPAAVADSVIEAFASAPFAEQVPGLAAMIRSDMEIPPLYGPIEDLRMERDGTLWIRLRDTGEGRPYLVLAPDGSLEGLAMFPTNASVYAADRDAVWTVELDEFDVPSVVRYRVAGR